MQLTKFSEASHLIRHLPQAPAISVDPPIELSGHSTWKEVKNGVDAVWDGTKWVAKASSKVLGPIGNVLTAYQIYQWAKRSRPYQEPPARVRTEFIFSGPSPGMRYQWPNGSMESVPPPGYGAHGARLW